MPISVVGPESITIEQAEVGDYFIGRNCTLRLCSKYAIKDHAEVFRYVCKFKPIAQPDAESTILLFQPGAKMTLALSIREAWFGSIDVIKGYWQGY